jgi:hypothetical protein
MTLTINLYLQKSFSVIFSKAVALKVEFEWCAKLAGDFDPAPLVALLHFTAMSTLSS